MTRLPQPEPSGPVVVNSVTVNFRFDGQTVKDYMQIIGESLRPDGERAPWMLELTGEPASPGGGQERALWIHDLLINLAARVEGLGEAIAGDE